MTEQPESIHFFSWESRVSLLLPMGFEEYQQDKTNHSVIYADDLDEDDEAGARLLVKCTRLFPGQQQAELQLAEQTASLPGHRLIQRDTVTLAGIPAICQQLEIKDGETEQMALDACLQLDDLLFSIHCRAPLRRADEYQPIFQGTLNSLRLILLSEDRPASLDPDTGHLAHHALQLSAWLPDGWTPIEEKPETLRFYGPASADHAGYQPTFSITLAEPNDYSGDWLERLVTERADQLINSTEYQLLEQRTLQLPDLMPAQLLSYRWQADDDHCFHLLQVFIRSGYRNFYLINAATLEALTDQHLPLFDQMIRELRFLPSH